MKSTRIWLLPALLASALFSTVHAADKPKELFWDDLMPEFWQPEESAVDHDNPNPEMVQQSLDAPVVKELNGQLIKLPGFIVPLEGDDKVLTEFLLVPYFGACVHVPPPPPNQIVHVKYPGGAPIGDYMYDAVVLTGKISTSNWNNEMVTVGYTMQGSEIGPYEE